MEKRIRYLYRKYLNNSCTKEEFEELFDYIHSSPEDLGSQEILEKLYDQEFNKSRSRVPVFAMAAAVLLILMAGSGWFLLKNSGSLAANKRKAGSLIKKTERSEYKYLLLPDSTQVWLNAASSLEFGKGFGNSAGKAGREVFLKGEAFFDVKHADKIPFIIYTGKVSTIVLGTAFNIKAYPDQQKITVSVKRGKVKVNYSDKEVAMLTKGQQVSIGSDIGTMKQKQVKEEETSAWQEGNLIYDDYRIGDIIAELEKIYNSQIIIEEGSIKNVSISTSFKREEGVEKALEVICRLTDTELLVQNGVYIIK